MNILFDHQAFSMQTFGGISRYFYQLIRGLSQQHKCILSLKYSNNYYIRELSDMVFNHFLENFHFKGKIVANELVNRPGTKKMLREKDFDLFHPTYYNPYFLKDIGKKPFVITVHDLTHEIFPSEFSRWDKTAEHKKTVIKKASHIIAVSRNTKNDIIERFRIPEEKISVVYHGYDMKVKSKNDSPDIQIPEKYILYVGARNRYKNFTNLVKAIPPLIRQDDQLHLVCTGGGSFTEEEKKLFASLGITDRLFQYTVSDAMLGWLYQHALCFVYPSFYEGFGLPVLEAFSYNCPVIVSNRSSLPEVSGDAALIIEPENPASILHQLEKLHSDEQLRQQLINKGHKRLTFFSWERTVRETEQVYNSLV